MKRLAFKEDKRKCVDCGKEISKVSTRCKSCSNKIVKIGNKNRLGKKHKIDTKKKISKANKGKVSPFKGKHHTEKTKEKIRQANKNKLKPWLQKRIGKKHPLWRGGVKKSHGYIFIYLGRKKYTKRANLVWFKHTGEVIKRPYMIHHKNGVRDDDRFENLQKLTISEHATIENNKRWQKD